MATDIEIEDTLQCDGTDTIYRPLWSNVVGDSTLNDGGYVGDLLKIARAHLEDAKDNGELREEDSGEAYSTAIMESMKNAIAFELQHPKIGLEMCFLRAQIDKLICDCDNETRLTTSKIELNDAQIDKLICDCTNETNMTDSKISLNAAQENKLACDCCNNSKATESKILLEQAQITKLECECANDTAATNSKILLNSAQEEKLACDCANSTKVSSSQSNLYDRQAQGFDDNAYQKLYETQMNGWAMVFADTDLETVTPSIEDAKIDSTYSTLKSRLATLSQ